VQTVSTTYTRELERLTHSGLALADPASDMLDREVLDSGGNRVGTVVDMLVDPEERVVRMVEVETGGRMIGLGRKRRLIPVQLLTGGDPRTIYVERTLDEINAAPEYRPAEGDAEEDQYAATYAAYGVTPYWQS
jgi:sporulation protein YlmC with PRC-barrel domain